MFRKVEISHKTIIFTVFFLVFLFFLYSVRDILLQLFVALILMSVLEPLVKRFGQMKIPRSLSILLSYILVFGTVGVIIALIIPPLVSETAGFIGALPGYINNLNLAEDIKARVANELLAKLGGWSTEIIRVSVSLFSNVFSILTVLVFTFYMLLSRDKLEDHLGIFFGEPRKKELGDLIDTFDVRLGGWARGQLALMAIVGILTYIGLVILGVPFALPLALLAGLFEIVPYVGPIVAAIPSALIGFGISPFVGFGVVILSVIVQQVENYLLVPKIMEKTAGISPIVTLIALAIGARMAGVIGMIISVPTVIAAQIIIKERFFKD